MKQAIAELNYRLESFENNEPIQRAEGRIEDADHSAAAISDLRSAIRVLERADKAFEGEQDGETGLSFSQALLAAKLGNRVARSGWNGKGMWVAMGDARADLPAEKFWNPHARAFAEANDGKADVLPYLIFKTADGKILMGWLASQTDLLANDWEILPD